MVPGLPELQRVTQVTQARYQCQFKLQGTHFLPSLASVSSPPRTEANLGLLQRTFHSGVFLAHHPRLRSIINTNSVCRADTATRVAPPVIWQLSDAITRRVVVLVAKPGRRICGGEEAKGK